MNLGWFLVILTLYWIYKTHQFPAICLGSTSRLLVCRLEKLPSFPLYKNLFSHFFWQPRNSPFHFYILFLPVTSSPVFPKARIILASFLQQRKMRRKGMYASLFSSFLILKMATHILKHWQEKWKFMTRRANMPLGETVHIFVNLDYCFQNC